MDPSDIDCEIAKTPGTLYTATSRGKTLGSRCGEWVHRTAPFILQVMKSPSTEYFIAPRRVTANPNCVRW